MDFEEDISVLIRFSSPPLERILSNQKFTDFLRNWDDDCKRFIASSFKDMYKLVFGPTDLKVAAIKSFMSIFRIAPFEEMDDIYNESKFYRFLLDLPERVDNYKPIKLNIYFMILQELMFDNNFNYRELSGCKNLLEKLMNEIENEFVYEFMENVISKYGRKMHDKLIELGVIKSAFDNITGSSLASFNSQRLVKCFIDVDFADEIAEHFIRSDKIGIFLWFTIEQRDKMCFSFLKYLFDISSKYIQNANWKTINTSILYRKKEFCKMIYKHDTYDEVSNISLGLLHKCILNDKRVDDNIIRVISKMSNDFFIFPTNSFLHNALLSTFRLLDDNGLLNNVIVKDFAELLSENYKIVDKDEVSIFNGQIYLIFSIIKPYIQLKGKNINQMKSFYKQRESVVKILRPETAREKNKLVIVLTWLIIIAAVLFLLMLVHKYGMDQKIVDIFHKIGK